MLFQEPQAAVDDFGAAMHNTTLPIGVSAHLQQFPESTFAQLQLHDMWGSVWAGPGEGSTWMRQKVPFSQGIIFLCVKTRTEMMCKLESKWRAMRGQNVVPRPVHALMNRFCMAPQRKLWFTQVLETGRTLADGRGMRMEQEHMGPA